MAAVVETLRISTIKVDPAIQIRRGTDEDILKRYEECFDVLPAVLVYRTPEGQLLADGFHRVAVAQRLGRHDIRAEIREGSREDALEAAVLANVAHGFQLKPDERDDGIRRLHFLRPKWTQQEIAKAMSATEFVISRALAIQEIRQHVLSRKLQRIPDSLLFAVAAAPKQHWEALLGAADKRGWTRDGIQQAVRNLNDSKLAETFKRRILAGESDPVEVAPDGTPGVSIRFVDKKTAKARKAVPPDPVGPDVAERLQPVRIEVLWRYQLPSTKTRKRNLKDYKRESEHIERGPYEVVVNHEALDGFGDANDPNSKGLVMALRQLNRDLWKIFHVEGWPRQERIQGPDRPGMA